MAPSPGLTREATGVWSAPGRVNLIGEHTDYNDGLCLPMALPQRTTVTAGRRDDDLVRVTSVQADGEVAVRVGEIGPGRPAGWAAYAAGVVWALREAGHDVGGVDLHVDGKVPLGAGLSSSAALECAVAVALVDLFDLPGFGDDAGRMALARVCAKAENDIAQAPTGGMDQAIAILGRAGHALLLDFDTGAHRQVPVPLADKGFQALIINTNAEHALGDGQYGSRRQESADALSAIGARSYRAVTLEDVGGIDDDLLQRRARHVVSEIARVRAAVDALDEGDVDALGALFAASHASMRDDYEISCPELDLAVETALAAGALAARMTGGGFGGSAVAIVPQDRVAHVEQAVRQAFAGSGFAEPDVFPADASDGAHRDT